MTCVNTLVTEVVHPINFLVARPAEQKKMGTQNQSVSGQFFIHRQPTGLLQKTSIKSQLVTETADAS
jgi:hypothetical protein